MILVYFKYSLHVVISYVQSCPNALDLIDLFVAESTSDGVVSPIVFLNFFPCD